MKLKLKGECKNGGLGWENLKKHLPQLIEPGYISQPSGQRLP
jgi:hypothetical protein